VTNSARPCECKHFRLSAPSYRFTRASPVAGRRQNPALHPRHDAPQSDPRANFRSFAAVSAEGHMLHGVSKCHKARFAPKAPILPRPRPQKPNTPNRPPPEALRPMRIAKAIARAGSLLPPRADVGSPTPVSGQRQLLLRRQSNVGPKHEPTNFLCYVLLSHRPTSATSGVNTSRKASVTTHSDP